MLNDKITIELSVRQLLDIEYAVQLHINQLDSCASLNDIKINYKRLNKKIRKTISDHKGTYK